MTTANFKHCFEIYIHEHVWHDIITIYLINQAGGIATDQCIICEWLWLITVKRSQIKSMKTSVKHFLKNMLS